MISNPMAGRRNAAIGRWPTTFAWCAAWVATAALGEPYPTVVVRAVQDQDSAATLTGRPPAELPLSTGVLEVEAYAERRPGSPADLADYLPGVSRRSNYWGQETPTFQLRGFNAGDASAYYKDGFRYQGRGPVAMANVAAVEIVRGPVAAVYGWAEPGGAVLLRTKQPDDRERGELTFDTDRWGKTAFGLDLGGRGPGTAQTRLVAAWDEGGSFRERQDKRQILIAPAAAWDLAAGRRLSVALEYLDDARSTDYGIPAIRGRPASVPVGRIYTEDWGRQHSRSWRVTSRWSQPAWDGELALAISHYRLRYLQYRDVEPYAVNGTTIHRWFEDYPEQYRWTTAHLDWSGRRILGGLEHRLTTRVELTREQRSLAGGILDEYAPIDALAPVYGQPSPPTADYSVYDQAWTNRGIAWTVQDEIRGGAWTWLLGVRLGALRQEFDYADRYPAFGEQHAGQTDRALSPRLGALRQIAPGLAWYINYSTGKAPVLPQNRAYDGSPFHPVSGRQWESGLKAQPANRAWLATAAIFDIARDHVPTRDPEHPAYAIQTGRQRSRGLELAWRGNAGAGWQATAQATWLDPRIVSDNRYRAGNRLPYAPRFGASAWLSRDLPDTAGHAWRIGIGVVRQGDRYADFANTAQVPAYTRFDCGISYLADRWSATLSVENLTDRRYYASGVENRPAVIYPGAPRTLGLRLTARFR